ncbi:peptide deformylase [Myroides marinus]|uniref:Peptide deformylase n=1 Tax=Myroides marinus TaxID=703342 RepID=A0A165RJ73_9FLAO|nr:peptide deformylase [Myroides marinus]KUF43835.1 peptide deformylase [Myroides marinus]KZE82622.1 peptide deformylase [Myroides marinus]MDM1348536.1 peptide deformylase [Myroides marinus]MDM1352047.1 peptide deformylase [Myroides marinus]MDM1355655.1 peptide deformylase [Myroides marinus]
MSTYSKLNDIENLLIKQNSVDIPMHVFQVDNPQEEQVLRAMCEEVLPTDENLKYLIARMYKTVQSEEKPGVGIAAPQVGINRRVFLVQRMDKEGEPFEFFINPEIVWYSKIQRRGDEGCLSIADAYGQVHRSLAIQITYYDLSGEHFQEVVEGFTAVIMQHEFDHLNGVLFTDRMIEQENNQYYNASPTSEIVYLR